MKYELYDGDTKKTLFGADNLSDFFDELDELFEEETLNSDDDGDSFRDSFWGGEYYIMGDVVSYGNPGDFIVAVNYVEELIMEQFMGEDWYNDGASEDITSLYEWDEQEGAKIIFEDILTNDFGMTLDEVYEKLENYYDYVVDGDK